MRSRSLITESWVESHSCPHITEAMICDDPICFLWRVTSQGPCVPYNGSCGSGTQEQTVECFSVTGEQLTFFVSQKHPSNHSEHHTVVLTSVVSLWNLKSFVFHNGHVIFFFLLLSRLSRSSVLRYFQLHTQMISCLCLISPPLLPVGMRCISQLFSDRFEIRIFPGRLTHVTIFHCSSDTHMHRDKEPKESSEVCYSTSNVTQ